MAVTPLTIAGNRIGAVTVLTGGVTGVAVDASVNEFFTMPSVGFGDLWIRHLRATLYTFSGVHVNSTHLWDGIEFRITDSTGNTVIDTPGSGRFVATFNTAATPYLTVDVELQNTCLMRRDERLAVMAPIQAGAGVTANVVVYVRGVRIAAT